MAPFVSILVLAPIWFLGYLLQKQSRAIGSAPLPTPHFKVTKLMITSAGDGVGVTDVNDKGQIVGFHQPSDVQVVPFLWQKGMVKDINHAYLMVDGLVAINNNGEIVGLSRSDKKTFIWKDGRRTVINTLVGGQADVRAINDVGQIVGSSSITTAHGPVSHAFLWKKAAAVEIGPIPGFENSAANSINNRGQVVVEAYTNIRGGDGRAFLWQRGKIISLGTLGGKTAYGLSINNSGHIVGSSDTLSRPGGLLKTHAFLWKAGTMKDLGTLGGSESQANRINNADEVVGTADTATGKKVPFLWQNGKMYDLNDLIPAKSGWILEDAVAINNKGQIIGSGNDGFFLLTPG